MSVVCLDGEVSDKELAIWHAAALDVRVQLTRAQVRAALNGPCLSRGVALCSLTAAQILKLFPTHARRKNAWKLRGWATRVSTTRARAVLASASWHQLHAAAQYEDEDAQIRAAFTYAVHTPGRRLGRRSAPSP